MRRYSRNSNRCIHPGKRSQYAEPQRRIRFSPGEGVVELLVENGGWDPALGARPMRGAIQRLVEGPLAEKILAGEFAAGDAVRVEAIDGEIRFDRTAG